MGKLNVVDGKVVKDKRHSKDVNKKLLDNNDDNEFATGFKDFSAESKLTAGSTSNAQTDSISNTTKTSSITESANAWKDQKMSEFEDRFMNKIPQVGDLIERAGEMIQDFGKMVYEFGDRIEHFKRGENNKSKTAKSKDSAHH